ncbi:phosphatase activator [Lactarius pseudohatsudake]|nr:phosphatase activator [Lactarius pseudohatsudake]
MAGIITQVSQTPVQAHIQPPLLARLSLELRGKRFSVDRETIMNLPESPPATSLGDGGENSEEEEVYGVDHLIDTSPTSDFAPNQNPLLSKQAIIVLREELEYFSIPPKGGKASTDVNGIANESMLDLKRDCGKYLLEKRSIFTALQRNVNKENNIAEQHLIDMLCMSGFDREDEWGFRALEPSRCCISSIALVLLKTGIHHPATSGEKQVTIDYNQMATAQKLLLFWRKPARKCWWDGIEVELKQAGEDTPRIIKLWARRVWTLELSLVRTPSLH